MALRVNGFEEIFQRSARNTIEATLFYILGEAALAEGDPIADVLDRFTVDKINLDQASETLQHEYLSFDTVDTKDEREKTRIMLDRMVSPDRKSERNPTPLNIDVPVENNTSFASKVYEKIKEIVDCTFSAVAALASPASDSDHLSSLEKGSLPPASLPSEFFSMTDGVTISASESAESISDAVSDSLDWRKTPANDRFSGETFASSPLYRNPQTLRSFSPNRLTLFEFCLIAYVVHKLYPNYTTVGTNCYFFAGLVYAAAELYGGIRPGTNTTSNLSQHGRWNGVKVSRVKHEDATRVVSKFKQLLSEQIGKVSLCSFRLLTC